METLIASVIALIGAIIGVCISNRKLGSKLQEKRLELGGEHKDILHQYELEKTSISHSLALTSSQIASVAKATEYLKDEAIKADALKQHLPKQDLDLTFAFKQMTTIMEESAALRLENQRLREEVEHLRTLEHEHEQVHEWENER